MKSTYESTYGRISLINKEKMAVQKVITQRVQSVIRFHQF